MFDMRTPICEPNGPHMLTGGAKCVCGATETPVIISRAEYDALSAAQAEVQTLRGQLEPAVTALNLLMNAVALMNSMILSGESHSSTSRMVMTESLLAARDALAAQPAAPKGAST